MPGHLGDQRDGAAGEPQADDPQHADEGHRVAGADQHAGGDRRRHVGRQGEHQLAGGHRDRAGQDHPPGAEPVQGHADRHLQGRVDGQLQHEEQGDRGRTGGEPLLGVDRRDPQRRAVEHRHHVRRERHAPDDVGARHRAARSRRSRAGSPRAISGKGHLRMTPARPDTFRAAPVSSVTAPVCPLQSRPMRNLVDPADDPAVDDGQRRGRILWALASCMAEKGFQATTISDIAARGPGLQDRRLRALPRQGGVPARAVLPRERQRAGPRPAGPGRRPGGRPPLAGPAPRGHRRLSRDAGHRPGGRLGGPDRGPGRRPPRAGAAPVDDRPLRRPARARSPPGWPRSTRTRCGR